MLEARVRPPDRAPAEALRRRLEAARDAGETFELAWPPALEATVAELRGSRFERYAWGEAFDDTVEAWAAAYARAGAGWQLSLELLEASA